MTSSFIYNRTNFKRNSYLSQLEFVNKYNLDDKKKIPCLNEVVIEFPIKRFLTGFFSDHKNEFNLDVQIKAVLVLYLLIFNFPFLNYKVVEKQIKSYSKSGDIRHFSLKVTLTQKEAIDQFLIKTFIESGGLNFELQKKKGAVFHNVVVAQIVYLHKFLEINFFLNRILVGLNSQDLFVNLTLKIFNPSSLKMRFLPFYV